VRRKTANSIYNSVGPVLTCCLNQTEKHQRCRRKMFCFSPYIASVKSYKCCFSSIRSSAASFPRSDSWK